MGWLGWASAALWDGIWLSDTAPTGAKLYGLDSVE
jgi:hypothetical protein